MDDHPWPAISICDRTEPHRRLAWVRTPYAAVHAFRGHHRLGLCASAIHGTAVVRQSRKARSGFAGCRAGFGRQRVAAFLAVTFPLSLPGVYAGAALVFIPALGIFAIPDILGGTEGIMIGNVIKQQFLDTRDWPFGSVLSMVLTVLAVVLAGAAAWIAKRART